MGRSGGEQIACGDEKALRLSDCVSTRGSEFVRVAPDPVEQQREQEIGGDVEIVEVGVLACRDGSGAATVLSAGLIGRETEALGERDVRDSVSSEDALPDRQPGTSSPIATRIQHAFTSGTERQMLRAGLAKCGRGLV